MNYDAFLARQETDEALRLEAAQARRQQAIELRDRLENSSEGLTLP